MTTTLSKRQLEILAFLFVGKTNGEIADCLACSALTVKNHVMYIMRKLSANNRQHAVYRGLMLGILKLPEHPADAPAPAAYAPSRIEPVADWLVAGNIRISGAARALEIGGRPVKLGGLRFDMLYLLIVANDRISRYEHLISRMYGLTSDRGSKMTVSIYRSQIQAVLVEAGASHEIENVRGIGYRLVERAAVPA